MSKRVSIRNFVFWDRASQFMIDRCDSHNCWHWQRWRKDFYNIRTGWLNQFMIARFHSATRRSSSLIPLTHNTHSSRNSKHVWYSQTQVISFFPRRWHAHLSSYLGSASMIIITSRWSACSNPWRPSCCRRNRVNTSTACFSHPILWWERQCRCIPVGYWSSAIARVFPRRTSPLEEAAIDLHHC